MGLTQTILFYLLIGAGVSAALLMRGAEIGTGARVFRALTGLVFWPLYVPALLVPTQQPAERTQTPASAPTDSMAVAIRQVEAELDRALGSLDGWAENVLAEEQTRLAELRAAWRVQAERIRELDKLLVQPEFLSERGITAAGSDAGSSGDRLRQSEQARRENIERLRALRGRLHEDRIGTLGWVRELVTMIHLAKFTGAPASRAEELVAQIAAAVEGLSEVSTWREPQAQPIAHDRSPVGSGAGT